MSRLKKIYRDNIYGVMGTLVFHILVVSFFLLADMDINGEVKEKEIIIEFPEILPPEVLEPTQSQERTSGEEITNTPSNQSPNLSQPSSRALNKTSANDKFFDKDYQAEIDAAKKLTADVNKQLQKKVIDIDDIKMPVETTEGVDPDSIKNVIYSGESNITYFLDKRYHLRLPIPIYLAQGGGRIDVDIVVARNGSVIRATSRKSPSVSDPQVYYYAELAARNTVFNSDPSAPEQQKGSIRYNFIAQ